MRHVADLARLRTVSAPTSTTKAEPTPPATPLWERLVGVFDDTIQPLSGIGVFFQLTARMLVWLIRPPFRWWLLLEQADFFGVKSIFIVGLTGMFTGMVFALQLVYQLRYYGAEAMVGLVVFIALMRELAPVFTALMVTARGASATAAELGNMRVTEQIDALVTLGVSPVQYLIVPRVVASVLMMPLLCVLYTCVGMAGATFVAIWGLEIDFGTYLARIEAGVALRDFMMGMVKATVFGFIVSMIACVQGFNANGGAKGVGEATTRAVVQSAVVVLIANYVLTTLMTDL